MKKQNKYTEVLHDIYSRFGMLEPQVIVKEAADENNPLHEYFTWDDDVAGHNYRLWQARQLIRTIQVEFVGKQVDAYWNVKVEIDGKEKDAYVGIAKVIQSKDLLSQVLAQALNELDYWQKKYDQLKELGGLVNVRKLSKMKQQFL